MAWHSFSEFCHIDSRPILYLNAALLLSAAPLWGDTSTGECSTYFSTDWCLPLNVHALLVELPKQRATKGIILMCKGICWWWGVEHIVITEMFALWFQLIRNVVIFSPIGMDTFDEMREDEITDYVIQMSIQESCPDLLLLSKDRYLKQVVLLRWKYVFYLNAMLFSMLF